LSQSIEVLLSKYTQTSLVSNFFKRFRWGLKEKKIFAKELETHRVRRVFSSKLKKYEKSNPVFCIVHWNAPDFLLLNIKKIQLIYPNSKLYVLDNGSQESCAKELVTTLKRFENITLFLANPKAKLDHTLDHTLGLQVLLNYSAMQQDEFTVFLDQDCILFHNLDELLLRFSSRKDLLVIGARDYVTIPRQHNWLLPGHYLRRASKLIHPSLMIVQPKRIVELFGTTAFFPLPKAWEEARANKWSYEPYHSISYRCRGHILYLETRMHDEIPLLTCYYYNDTIYAQHAWYSSRTTLLPVNDLLDGIPVSSLLDVRKRAFEYMEQNPKVLTPT